MPNDIEQELLAAAGEADVREDEMYQESAPTGRYSKKFLNTTIKDLNQVNKMFGTEPYPAFDADVEGPLPGEFVRNLTMVLDAGGEYDAELYTFDLMSLVSDEQLMTLSGLLQDMAKDSGFKSFLKQTPEQEEEMPVEAAPVTTPVEGEEMPFNDLLASRM